MSDTQIGGPDPGGKTPGECAHLRCSCSTGDLDALYCSEGCKAADGSDVEKDDAEPCPCDHPDCTGH